jgi:RimJ/RimL family protein N-acetyltransferase
MTKTPTLETPRLLLRPLRLEDHIWAQKLFPHFEIIKHLNPTVPWPYPDNGVYTFYKDIILPAIAVGKKLYWIIVEKSSNTPIGALEITPGAMDDNRGFWIGLPFHGKGYMSEAVTATTDYAFDVLDMKKLMLTNAKPNTASARMKIKSGAILVKEIESDFVSGKFIKQIWEQTPENWRASPLKKKYSATESITP